MAFLDNIGVGYLVSLMKNKYDALLTRINGKQDALSAGNNITISGNTISATDTTYTAGSNISISNGVISATDTTYTAGTGINISNGEISCTVTDTDTTYTAGTGISIDANNEISCTVSGGGSDYKVPFNLFSLIKNNAVAGQYQWHDLYGNTISTSDVPEISTAEIFSQLKSQGFAFVFAPRNNMQIDITDIKTYFGVQYTIIYQGVNSAGQNGSLDYFALSEGIYLIFVDNNSIMAFSNPNALTTFFTWPSGSNSSFPSAPSADGNYLLKCSVSSGSATYSWESVTTGGSY